MVGLWGAKCPGRELDGRQAAALDVSESIGRGEARREGRKRGRRGVRDVLRLPYRYSLQEIKYIAMF